VGKLMREIAALSHALPKANFKDIREYFAFYAGLFDWYVNGERVEPQPGGFYGGWIVNDLTGPFKGIPGSSGW
jgi:hypothetical protein